MESAQAELKSVAAILLDSSPTTANVADGPADDQSTIIDAIHAIANHLPNLDAQNRLKWKRTPNRALGQPNHMVVDTQTGAMASIILIGRVTSADVKPYGTYRGRYSAAKSSYRVVIDDGAIGVEGEEGNPFFGAYRRILLDLEDGVPDLKQFTEDELQTILPNVAEFQATKRVGRWTKHKTAVLAVDRERWDPQNLVSSDSQHQLQPLDIFHALTGEQLGPGSISKGDIVALDVSVISYTIKGNSGTKICPKLEINAIHLVSPK